MFIKNCTYIYNFEPSINLSKSHFEYKHFKLINDETQNVIYQGVISFLDFLIDDWQEIINCEDLNNKFTKTGFGNKLILDNNLFLKPIISKKVSHTYYDTNEKKNKTIKIK